MPQPIRFSVALSNQNIAWPDYITALQAADELAFETFWSFDHLMPIGGDPDGPCHECYTTLAAHAQATKRIRVGALVSGAAYRNPALQIKLATQVDVISGGRFDFGIGAGWAEREFRAYDLFLNPQPVQRPRPPILIGGGGEQLTLRVVARHADIWHGFGDLATLGRKMAILDGYAQEYGRDPGRIARSTNVSLWVGDPPAALRERLGGASRSLIAGTPEAIEARLREYVQAGITYFIVGSPGGVDLDNWRRISEQIIPRFQGQQA